MALAYHNVLSSLTGRVVGRRLLILPYCDTVNVIVINTRHLHLSYDGPNHDGDTFSKPHSGTPEFRAIRTRYCNSVTFVHRGPNSNAVQHRDNNAYVQSESVRRFGATALTVLRSYAKSSTVCFLHFSFTLGFNNSFKTPISAEAGVSPRASYSGSRGSPVHFTLG